MLSCIRKIVETIISLCHICHFFVVKDVILQSITCWRYFGKKDEMTQTYNPCIHVYLVWLPSCFVSYVIHLEIIPNEREKRLCAILDEMIDGGWSVLCHLFAPK